MGISKCSCEQCGKAFYIGNANFNWQDGNDSGAKRDARIEGYSKGTYNSRFCSKACANSWAQAHPGKSTRTFGERVIIGIFTLPFILVKLFLKLGWKLGKQILKYSWKIMKNKWVWTIGTLGFSLLTWKVLNAIYSPKK